MDKKTTLLGLLSLILAIMLLYSKCNTTPESTPTNTSCNFCMHKQISSSCGDSLDAINNSITEIDAKNLIDNYNSNIDKILMGDLRDSIAKLPIGEVFGRDNILESLQSDSCIGLNVYYGMTDDYKIKLVLVPQNADCSLNWRRALEFGTAKPTKP